MEWGLGHVLVKWGHSLTSPLGIVLMCIAGVYIFLRITGRIENPLSNLKGRRGNSGNDNRPPDYLL